MRWSKAWGTVLTLAPAFGATGEAFGDDAVEQKVADGIDHRHNVLFVENCRAIHAPGPGKVLTVVNNDHRLWHKNQYPAHVRRVLAASDNMSSPAASFAWQRYGNKSLYNGNIAFDKIIWAANCNCSQFVWAAFMYTSGNKIDLDYNGGPGVYPQDLWKSPLTVTNRYLKRAS